MKHTITIAVIVVAVALALAGCYIPGQDGAGSVGIELPPVSSTGDPAGQSHARIWILQGNLLANVGDAEGEFFKQVEIEGSDNEVSVGPVLAGSGYQVILALGTVDEGTGIFVPALYALSDEFSVVAGEATPVDLAPAATPFGYVPAVFGEELVGLVVTDAVYTATSAEAIALNIAGLTEADRDALPAGEEAVSLGVGAETTSTNPVPWINTNKGIIPYNRVDLDTWDLDTEFDADYPGVFPPVLSSGAFALPAGPPHELLAWFQVDGGLGGLYVNGGGVEQWLADIDLSEFISGQPVMDLVVDNAAGEIDGYFASKLGAFKLPDNVLTDDTIDTVPEILAEASFFEVTVNDQPADITRLALEGNDLYLGTSRGAVVVNKNDIDLAEIPSSAITLSLGRPVQHMAIGATYHAILTDHFLIVSGDAGASYSIFPIYAGIVTRPTGLFLDEANGTVLISGETGISYLDIDGT